MRIICCSILLSFFSQSLFAQACHPQDSLELVKFYHSVNGQNSTLDWVLTKPVSTWEWVGLKPNGRVKSLWLISKNLTGTLPPDLKLPELTLLGLGNNEITGTIPKFEFLPSLRELELPNNQLTGNIPQFDSPILQDLELGSNQLTGSIPKFNLPSLIALYLNNNQLTGVIPEFDTPQLGGMNLGHNQLTGEIPDFKNMPKLQHLNCQNNQLSGSIPAFGNLTGLWSLILDNNQLSGVIPNFHLPTLKTISLRNNLLDDKIPSFDLPNLRILDLSNNQLQGKISDMTLPSLFNLNLSDNQLSGQIPALEFPELGILNLSNNALEGPLPMMNLPKLKQLYLSNNQLSGNIPDFGSDLIEVLYLNHNRFTFENMEELVDTNLASFRFAPQANIPLIISGNQFSVDAGGTLANNTYLWYRDSILVYETTGDSIFLADQPGRYFCQVFNTILSNPSAGDSLVLVSEMHDYTVSVDEIYERPIFQLAPNPLAAGQSLQVLLEDHFSGPLRVEILSLDGRVLSSRSVTSEALQTLPTLGLPGSFFVRISDGKASATRLVFFAR